MNLEPRNIGEPIKLQLSGRELYLLWMGLNELMNQIDDVDLQTNIGVDHQTMDSAADNLTEIWWTLDKAERRTFIPGA